MSTVDPLRPLARLCQWLWDHPVLPQLLSSCLSSILRVDDLLWRGRLEVGPDNPRLLLVLVAAVSAEVTVQSHPGPQRPHGVARENLMGLLLLTLLLLLAVGPRGGQEHHLGVRVRAQRVLDQHRQT